MKIKKLYGIEGAKKAKGTTIIIDIFRAATVQAYLLAKNVLYIIPVSTKEEALELKKKNPSYIIIGEENGYKIKDFDFGNSPFEIIDKNLSGKIVVHRSSMGTQGIINAKNADEIIVGSFVIANAIKNYLLKKKPNYISIVSLDVKESEDDIFANYIINALEGKINPDIKTIINSLKNHPASRRFLNPEIKEFPKEDFYLCLDLDKFNFIVMAKKYKNQLIIKKMFPSY
jgi:2-phosphosulfolactate phosphatase